MPKLLFATHKPFFPDSLGGAQKSSIHIFKKLIKKGWKIEVLCRFPITVNPLGRLGFKDVFKALFQPCFAVKDDSLGFLCRRKPFLTIYSRQIGGNYPRGFIKYLDFRLSTFKPDIVFGDTPANSPLINASICKGIPTVHLVRSVPFLSIPSILDPQLHLIGNSPYTARVIEAVINKKVDVVLPGVASEEYRVNDREERYITFINPVPQKGVAIATRIARLMPDQKFLFVKGRWSGIGNGHIEYFLKSARKLKNVDVLDSQEDMRSVYKLTKILLVPSQFIETFGRVIIEAHINGIPVVAANVGGIPYTLGKGGALVDSRSDPNVYVEILRNFCEDQELYREVSEKALENSKRKVFSPEYQTENLLSIINNILRKGNVW